MTWQLIASGRALIAEGEHTSHSVERELLAELRAVLSKPKYGAAAARLRGLHVVDNAVHAPEPDAEPEAAVPDSAAPAAERRTKAAAGK